MGAAKKVKKTAAKSVKSESKPIQITWLLDELPSSQHKTGLVGLILLVRWLLRKRKAARRGVLKELRIDSGTVTLEFDQEGLSWLFDEAYAATLVESERDAPFKDVEPVRVVEREVVDKKKVDKKTGKPIVKLQKKYVYEIVQPNGALLVDADPTGDSGAWLKLWRDFVWSVLRAVPATRAPYNDRAAGEPTTDAEDTWTGLVREKPRSVELPSTYFVGAQAATAENVAFRDRERFQFLLNFWPFAVGLAVPTTVDREGKTHFAGYVLSFSDVADLSVFCDEYAGVLAARKPELLAYLPRQAVLDVPAEGGLAFLAALRERLATSEGKKRTRDLVLGVDIFHIERDGNNVRTRSTTRIEPSDVLQDEYERIRQAFKDPIFRRQRLTNLIAGRPWHSGFDRLFATLPVTTFIKGRPADGGFPSQFPFDVQREFTHHHNTEVSDG
jgi:CRISPR-associated protein Cmx8